jgi:hypothetical protein
MSWSESAKPDGTYERYVAKDRIRENGKPRYVKHPSADVAAFYSQIPQVLEVASTSLLTTDALLTQYEVGIGDEVLAAGYPLGREGPAGFPILRSGLIASFPIMPVAATTQILIDYNVWSGNSGGPVYLYERARWLNGPRTFSSVNIIMGLVSKQVVVNGQRLELAVVVPAHFIRETINMLPVPTSR